MWRFAMGLKKFLAAYVAVNKAKPWGGKFDHSFAAYVAVITYGNLRSR